MNYFPDSEPKREALYHAVLIRARKLGVGSVSADRGTRRLLLEHGTFENIYAQESRGMFSQGEMPVDDDLVRRVGKSPDFSILFNFLSNILYPCLSDVEYGFSFWKVRRVNKLCYPASFFAAPQIHSVG